MRNVSFDGNLRPSSLHPQDETLSSAEQREKSPNHRGHRWGSLSSWGTRLLVLCAVFGLFCWGKGYASSRGDWGWLVGSAKPGRVAVIELFTSEGCSSCPPADEVLAKIVSLSKRHKLPVYGLSFHVDYWNNLGWTDPFSRRHFSQRQSEYAQLLGGTSVYTPQMIVNGRWGFVGSRHWTAQKILRRALSSPSQGHLALRAKVKGSKISARFLAKDFPMGTHLRVALVEQKQRVYVPRGENAGRTLHHVNVVRVFRDVELRGKTKGALELTIPRRFRRKGASLVGYLQQRDGRILNATRLSL
ncbi:MAG: DUF1223 domain-containing protein [Myxococcales bacterium]|nr:DUF1223 domain-containing protein [Myxococcales bacterium]